MHVQVARICKMGETCQDLPLAKSPSLAHGSEACIIIIIILSELGVPRLRLAGSVPELNLVK